MFVTHVSRTHGDSFFHSNTRYIVTAHSVQTHLQLTTTVFFDGITEGLKVHHEMLSDVPRTESYKQAIEQASGIFGVGIIICTSMGDCNERKIHRVIVVWWEFTLSICTKHSTHEIILDLFVNSVIRI